MSLNLTSNTSVTPGLTRGLASFSELAFGGEAAKVSLTPDQVRGDDIGEGSALSC
jgi:hypothetical protein